MITINGRTYSGDNVSIINGVVMIDGVVQDGDKLAGVVKIVVEGVLGSLRTDASVVCEDVHGDVSAGGSANVNGDIGGNVAAGGSINCGNIRGAVSAGGSIVRR